MRHAVNGRPIPTAHPDISNSYWLVCLDDLLLSTSSLLAETVAVVKGEMVKAKFKKKGKKNPKDKRCNSAFYFSQWKGSIHHRTRIQFGHGVKALYSNHYSISVFMSSCQYSFYQHIVHEENVLDIMFLFMNIFLDEVKHWFCYGGRFFGYNSTEFPFQGLFVSTLREAGRWRVFGWSLAR